jgi:hypothetical protein
MLVKTYIEYNNNRTLTVEYATITCHVSAYEVVEFQGKRFKVCYSLNNYPRVRLANGRSIKSSIIRELLESLDTPTLMFTGRRILVHMRNCEPMVIDVNRMSDRVEQAAMRIPLVNKLIVVLLTAVVLGTTLAFNLQQT